MTKAGCVDYEHAGIDFLQREGMLGTSVSAVATFLAKAKVRGVVDYCSSSTHHTAACIALNDCVHRRPGAEHTSA